MTRSILVGVGDPADSGPALDWAAAEAARRHLRLHLVHSLHWLVRETIGDSPVVREAVLTAGRDLLAEAAARVRARAPEVVVESALDLHADAVHALAARAGTAELVVLGSKGRTRIGDLTAASASTTVPRSSPVPVVVVRPEATGEPSGPVVVGVDGSELSVKAVEQAFAEASLWGAPLRAVLAVPPSVFPRLEFAAYAVLGPELEEQERQAQAAVLAESLAGWRDKYPDVVLEAEVVPGHEASSLVAATAGARLLVVGSRGRGGFAGLLLGSVSATVVHHAHCPVMVVPA